MRFRVLGTLRILDGQRVLTIRAGRQRTLLAMLALDAGRLVTTDRLIDEIWDGSMPRPATRTMQGYLFRLRRVLGPGTLVTRRRGYELAIPPEYVDAHVFGRLVAESRRELAYERWDSASRLLSQALTLWRGPAALADVPGGPMIAAAAARLNSARADALGELRSLCLARADAATALIYPRPPG